MNTLSFFPTPYPDELLYSVLARYHLRSGNLSFKSTTIELFDTSNVIAVIDLNGHLNYLTKKLPVNNLYITADNLIFKHTMFPFYAAFLPAERYDLIVNSMKSNNGQNIHSRIGIVSSAVKSPQYLRFCPQCFKDDIALHGESYWKRTHQFPSILVCNQHKQVLLNSTVRISELGRNEYITANRENCIVSECNLPIAIIDKMLVLADDATNLLQSTVSQNGPEFYNQLYTRVLKANGLMTEGGNAKHLLIWEKFRSYYEATEKVKLNKGVVFSQKCEETAPFSCILLVSLE